jgi:hypothetical protein
MIFGFGSANFSSPALLRKAHEGNVEVLLLYPAIQASQFKAPAFFDPLDSAVVLKKKSQLSPPSADPDEPVHRARDYPLILSEAWLDETRLRAEWTGATTVVEISAMISQANARPVFLKCPASSDGRLGIVIDNALAKRLREAASILQIGRNLTSGWLAMSNPVLVANLQDLVTGGDIRRERQTKEARESPQRFMDVLANLSKGDDDERLKQFLTYCDIPFDQRVRLVKTRVGGTRGKAPLDGLRDLGARNLKHFEVLHDAVVDFVQRHRRRLERHIECGTAKGIPNFLHILLTIENLLLSQIDRLIFALEAESKTEMRAERWHQIRSNLDAYYHELEQLLELTAVEYLDAMMEAAPREKVTLQFSEGLPELMALYERAIQNRAALDHLRQTRLSISNPGGRAISRPEFFKSVLGEEKWGVFVAKLSRTQKQLRDRLAA